VFTGRCVALLLLVSFGHAGWTKDDSVEVTLEESRAVREEQDAWLARWTKELEAKMKDFEAKMNTAAARGKAAAEKDIKAGRFRIRACGQFVKKNETDSVTGYRIERIGLCSGSATESDAEVNAYNRTMREWFGKQKGRRVFVPTFWP
jgi:hypothetical protein